MIVKSVKLTAHTDEVDERVQRAIARALEKMGLVAEAYAKMNQYDTPKLVHRSTLERRK